MNSEIVSFNRQLKINLPKRQSAFLWGARKTGKSTYLYEIFPTAIYYDLLKADVCERFLKAPHLLREEILALPDEQRSQPIIIDEIQKVPALLDEVHYLIESEKLQFILCGSSARKLKRGAANLLGARAWRFEFYPLVYPEIPRFDLLRALMHGLLPSHYLSDQPKRFLKSYVQDYLQEEIQAEGLTRNLPAFARFLDAVGFCNGEMLNYSNIARECGVDSKTVREYFQILVDTLIGYLIYPWQKKKKRDIITATPKFYLFDTGVANYLAQTSFTELRGAQAGKSFEQFILMELMAYRSFAEKEFAIHYWRTKTGLEVDFILGNADIALEIKLSDHVDKSVLRGLIAFMEEHPQASAIVVSLDPRPRKMAIDAERSINIFPWQIFLEQLWAGKSI